jgi:hypothetical protein
MIELSDLTVTVEQGKELDELYERLEELRARGNAVPVPTFGDGPVRNTIAQALGAAVIMGLKEGWLKPPLESLPQVK